MVAHRTEFARRGCFGLRRGLLHLLEERDQLVDEVVLWERAVRVVPVSDTEIAAVVGGVNRVVISHVLARAQASLTELKPELLRFIKRNLAAHE
jgi:hypothetical protein